MMRTQRNYYEILGLSRSASTAEIKKRYRELVRKFHPDVVADKAFGEKAFVQITEAYKTLVDPGKRRAYDATLVDVTQPSRPQPGGGIQGPRPTSPQLSKLVKDAELAFIRRRFSEATELCRQAIRLDRTCARAHAILGDIYRARKLYDHAVNEYNYAVQFDPSDKQSEAKLERLIDRSAPITFSWESPDGRLSNEAIVFNIIGWGIAVFALFLVNIYPGEPIPWLRIFHLPIITSWSWNLIGIMFGDGVLVGFLLAVNGILDHPDDELIFESGGRGWGIIPTGFLLLLFAPIFFLGAAAFYLLLGFLQDTISKSVVVAFAAVAGVVLLAAMMYPFDRMSVVLFGGNVVFVGLLAGWYAGSIFRATS